MGVRECTEGIYLKWNPINLFDLVTFAGPRSEANRNMSDSGKL